MAADALMTTASHEGCEARPRTECLANSSSSALRRFRTRLRRLGLWKTFSYLVFVVLGERCGLRISCRFEFSRTAGRSPGFLSHGFDVAVACRPEDLTRRDRDFLQSYGEESTFLTRLDAGQRCLIVRSVEGELASVCWFRLCDGGDTPSRMAHSPDEASNGMRPGIIERCFTRYEYRGLGLYPWALHHIATSGDPKIDMHSRPIYVDCSPFNHASEAGITRAGFIPLCLTVRLGRSILFSRPVTHVDAVDSIPLGGYQCHTVEAF